MAPLDFSFDEGQLQNDLMKLSSFPIEIDQRSFRFDTSKFEVLGPLIRDPKALERIYPILKELMLLSVMTRHSSLERALEESDNILQDLRSLVVSYRNAFPQIAPFIRTQKELQVPLKEAFKERIRETRGIDWDLHWGAVYTEDSDDE